MNTQNLNASPEEVRQLTEDWVRSMVVGLNLCPFAAPVLKDQSLRFFVSEAKDEKALTADYLQELDRLMQADEKDISTTLLIAPYILADFYDYLDTLTEFEILLERAELEGVLQLASFHPGYLFGGVPAEDISHWTNRAPYPTFHIIREAQMSRALTHFKNPEEIPERNIQRLEKLGREGLIKRFPPFADYADS